MVVPNLDVLVQNHYGSLAGEPDLDQLPWQSWYQGWLEHTWQNLPSPAQHSCYELTLRLAQAEEVQVLNRDYRGLDRPTDVLSFASLDGAEALLPHDSAEPFYLGDIVISVPTAQHQAQQNGHSLVVELSWLAVHGFLHLLGWDHPDEDSFNRMVNQQIWLLQSVGLVPPNAIETSESVEQSVEALDSVSPL